MYRDTVRITPSDTGAPLNADGTQRVSVPFNVVKIVVPPGTVTQITVRLRRYYTGDDLTYTTYAVGGDALNIEGAFDRVYATGTTLPPNSYLYACYK